MVTGLDFSLPNQAELAASDQPVWLSFSTESVVLLRPD
jgi:hypothetical protein